MKTIHKLLIVLLALPFAGQAVFIGTGTPNSNNSQPAGDQGWSSMGIYNEAGSVYLGDGWFITAAHLGTGAGPVNFGGVNYSISSWVNITNSNETTADADIRLFQISNPGAISASGSQINTSTLSLNDPLTMIGYGRDVSSITTNKYFDPGRQTQIRYYQGTDSQMKWGNNQISGFDSEYTEAGYTSKIFETTLGSGTAQALDKDSGGGVFIYDDVSGDYLLAGIMIGALRYSDGNGVFAVTDTGNPSVNSTTTSVNLSLYADQINQTIPEPTTGIFIAAMIAAFGVVRRARYMAR